MAIDLSVAGHMFSTRNIIAPVCGTKCHCDATPIWHFHLICLSCALNTFRCVCISKCVAEFEWWPKFLFRFMINVCAVGQRALLSSSKYFLHVNENMLCVQCTMAQHRMMPTDRPSFSILAHIISTASRFKKFLWLHSTRFIGRTKRECEWTTMFIWIVCGFGIVSESLG